MSEHLEAVLEVIAKADTQDALERMPDQMASLLSALDSEEKDYARKAFAAKRKQLAGNSTQRKEAP